ncbi:hypothetical protein G6F68_014240 [Rhizopus microsporus]|nr:hypothetical protein G6F68_014240 [Rhizopus microsporus]
MRRESAAGICAEASQASSEMTLRVDSSTFRLKACKRLHRQRAYADARAGQRTRAGRRGALGDIADDAAHRSGDIARTRGIDHFAAGVIHRVPQLIDRFRLEILRRRGEVRLVHIGIGAEDPRPFRLRQVLDAELLAQRTQGHAVEIHVQVRLAVQRRVWIGALALGRHWNGIGLLGIHQGLFVVRRHQVLHQCPVFGLIDVAVGEQHAGVLLA